MSQGPVVTPVAAQAALVAALTAQGLTKATSHMGVAQQGSPKLDRSFAVIPLSGGLGSGRIGTQTPGPEYVARFRVELGHMLKPKGDSGDAYTTALTDTHRALAAVTDAFSNTFTLTDVAYSKEASGQYLVTTFSVSVSFRLDLSGPA